MFGDDKHFSILLRSVIDMDEGNGVVIDEEKHKLWYAEATSEKCYACPQVLSCLNKVCPRNRLIRNREYSCKQN